MPFRVFIQIKATPKGAKVDITLRFGIGHDVSEQTLTLTRTGRHFRVLLSAALTKISIIIRRICKCKEWQIKGKSYLIIFYAIYTPKPTLVSLAHSFIELQSTTKCRQTFLISKQKVVLVNMTP